MKDKKISEILSKQDRYKEGFSTDLISERIKRGLNEETIRTISRKRKEPSWMLEFRLEAYSAWLKMKEPHWLKAHYKPIDYNNYIYYSTPFSEKERNSISSNKNDEAKGTKNRYLTKEVELTFKKLGIPTKEGEKNIALDAIFDSVSVSTTYQKNLIESGVIFCSFGEAVQKYPEIVQKYIGSVVPIKDNFFSALNSSVFSDGTFVYISKGVRCPMELSTYFRINDTKTGQFERTILIADKGSCVDYIEGCSAPIRKDYQLHVAVVEVVVLENAEVRYSTVQNWFSGKKDQENGILNFVTKRALCKEKNSKMSWTQSETGSAITWKYPSVILEGENSTGKFLSVALTNGSQRADTGTKMVHIGKNTRSIILSKGISVGESENTYRGLVKILPSAAHSRNFTKCDSILIGDQCGSHTFPDMKVYNNTSQVEHEATTSKINEEQLFYCCQRGIDEESAISMIVSGFCTEVFSNLPLEFAVEAKKLLRINLENRSSIA